MPARGENVEAARAFCADCPVKLECLEFAMSLPELRCQGGWVARLFGRVVARIGVGSARWSYSPSSTAAPQLHHNGQPNTVTHGQLRSPENVCSPAELQGQAGQRDERDHLAKVRVAGSSPVVRSTLGDTRRTGGPRPAPNGPRRLASFSESSGWSSSSVSTRSGGRSLSRSPSLCDWVIRGRLPLGSQIGSMVRSTCSREIWMTPMTRVAGAPVGLRLGAGRR
jgi:hypothetical protein